MSKAMLSLEQQNWCLKSVLIYGSYYFKCKSMLGSKLGVGNALVFRGFEDLSWILVDSNCNFPQINYHIQEQFDCGWRLLGKLCRA